MSSPFVELSTIHRRPNRRLLGCHNGPQATVLPIHGEPIRVDWLQSLDALYDCGLQNERIGDSGYESKVCEQSRATKPVYRVEFRQAYTHSRFDESNLEQADPRGLQGCDSGIVGAYRRALKVGLNPTTAHHAAEDVQQDEGC